MVAFLCVVVAFNRTDQHSDAADLADPEVLPPLPQEMWCVNPTYQIKLA